MYPSRPLCLAPPVTWGKPYSDATIPFLPFPHPAGTGGVTGEARARSGEGGGVPIRSSRGVC